MKRKCVSGAELLPGRECLGRTCGTNIDTEDVEFAREFPNLTYLDKVFSFNKDTASPILFNLNTGGMQSGNFITELFLDGSSLFPCTLSPNAVFEIDNSFVAVDFFSTRPPGNINASQVTVDGFPVDSVNFENGQYTARTDNLLAKVLKNRCLERNLPTKVFFLISNAGPWDFRATYVLEGRVNTNGRICRFRAVISNAPNAPNSMLSNGSRSSFAIRNLSLPCSINGVAPEIRFQFSAKINLVNPRLVVNCMAQNMTSDFESSWTSECEEDTSEEARGIFHQPSRPPCHPHPPCPPCPPCPPVISPTSCTVSLVSTVSVEPVAHVETVRKTLFCINACEGLQPCDGSLIASEEEEEEECEIQRVPCKCRPGCHSKGNCHRREETTEEVDRNSRREVAGIRDHGRFHFNNEVMGESDRAFIRNLAREICDEEEVLGEDECIEPRALRPAFRRNGCNGCSW